ncbi:acyltransferase domain-containing protein [Nocardia seriolae]|uniref:acyltransferase domain-containing protein n=1 Tax=Nocardia seriolae TaxID=37332 RepID=UPI0030CAA7F8
MTEVRSAALFPGQGAYAPGALAEVADRPEVREVLRDIDAVTRRLAGGTVSERLCAPDAPAIDELLESDPDLLQAAIYAASVAAYRMLLARGPRPDVLVGHSFGEIAALVCAGAYSTAAGAEIVCHRSAALRSVPAVDGYQLALGADLVRSERILRLIGDPDAVVAVENHDGQTVVAGPCAAIDTAQAVATALGIGAVPLHSPYPFHSPLLREALIEFGFRTRDLAQARLSVEVYSPILGRAYRDTDKLAVALAGHLTRRVRFATALRELRTAGVEVFVECGALDALSRITGRVLGADVVTVPLLVPGARIPETLAAPTAERSAPVRLRDSRVERIARLVIDEVSAALAEADARGAEPPAEPAAPAAADAAESVAERPRAVEFNSGEQLFGQLVVLYADALEYPPEVFEPDTDLEAELGVDSVKQTELLRRVGERYGLGPLPADFKIAEHNTLGRIADLIVSA